MNSYGVQIVQGYTWYQKVIRWIKYGVFLSVFPFLLPAIFEHILGYPFDLFRLEYIPSFLLTAFAIATNARSYSTDEEKIPDGEKKVFQSIRGAFSTICYYSMGYSFVVYIVYTLIKRLAEEKIVDNIWINLCNFAAVTILINLFIGAFIEIRSVQR